MATCEDLYKYFGTLVDAKDDAGKVRVSDREIERVIK